MDNESTLYIKVLGEISHTSVHEKNAHKLLETILTILDKDLGMRRSMFTLLHCGMLEMDVTHGISNEEKNKNIFSSFKEIIEHVTKTGRTHLIDDISSDKRFKGYNKKNTAFICAPIIRNERIIGSISAEIDSNKKNDFQQEAKLMEIVGNIAAEAVFVSHNEYEEKQSIIEENKKLRTIIEGSEIELIGRCRSMQEIYTQIRQAAPSDARVLIRGASGTGKELAARSIVNLSNRKNKPFIILNCATLPDNLVESELYGYEKGAFTGAVSRKQGRAEHADGGTLFLDEIGDLSLMAQVKLLRFIQENTFTRLGGTTELHSDVRIIAATSRDLEKLIANGRFREDLYYRLNVFQITMPPLNKHRCDIILLAEHFITKFNLKYNKNVNRISTPAINLLMSYSWPGNVRELENCIERAVLTSQNSIIFHYDLPPSIRGAITDESEENKNLSFNTLVNTYEKNLITEALLRNDTNMSAAARDIGLSPRMIHYKINNLGIDIKKITKL